MNSRLTSGNAENYTENYIKGGMYMSSLRNTVSICQGSRVLLILLFFTLFIFVVKGSALAFPAQTGQTTCYDTSGTPIGCANTGQDGNIRAGVAWPSPRFTDNGNGTVTDRLTGLIWLKDPGCFFSPGTWSQALTDSNNLASSACGLSDGSVAGDWRLPNVNELESLINAEQAHSATWLNSQGFNNVQASDNSTGTFKYYWTSTTFSNNSNRAWVVLLDFGHVGRQSKGNSNYIWPVRSGTGGTIQLPKTGQTIGLATGDDGDLEEGVTLPVPRFSVNGDGTFTDNLTQLVWTPDANAPGPAACNPGVAMQWQEALDFVKCLNINSYLGHTDWRLPNRKELRSLVDYSAYDPPLQAGYPFTSVQRDFYWASTTGAYSPSSAWDVDMINGNLDLNVKDSVSYRVWPVRGGPTATPIPTLTEWGMMIFVVFAGIGSICYLRRQRRTI